MTWLVALHKRGLDLSIHLDKAFVDRKRNEDRPKILRILTFHLCEESNDQMVNGPNTLSFDNKQIKA